MDPNVYYTSQKHGIEKLFEYLKFKIKLQMLELF